MQIRLPSLPRILPPLSLACALAALPGVLVLAWGCGGAKPPPPVETASVAAPYPFSVSEIRAGCPFGRVIEYRIEKAGSPPRVESWAFTPVDNDTVSIATTAFDLAGNPIGSPTHQTAKWTELHEHAHFPSAATTISNESLSTSAGTFDVMRYVVTQGDEVRTYWFARTLPGPPVKVEVVKGGQTVSTMLMQANRTH
ncbi:MAG: hypothetical protein ACLQVI_19095 [Polyangiaceae bacterium]